MDGHPFLRRLVPAFLAAVLCSAAILCSAGPFVSARAASRPRNGESTAAGRKDDKSSDAHTTKLKLRVLTDDDKPVGNASVYVRFYTDGGFMHHDKLAELDLKTNQDGTVKVPPIPQGKILIQVIATGWHTFGKWYDVEQDEESIEIKLEPPPHWY
jgi:hypothetical protein